MQLDIIRNVYQALFQINQKAKHATDYAFYLLNALCECYAKLHSLKNNNNECLIYVIYFF